MTGLLSEKRCTPKRRLSEYIGLFSMSFRPSSAGSAVIFSGYVLLCRRF